MKNAQYDSTLFLYGLIAAGLTLFMVLAPFNNALFYNTNYLFERPVFAWLLVLAPTGIVAGILMYMKRDRLSKGDILLYGIVLLVPLSATVSHLFSKASYSSYQSLLISLTAAVLFIASHLLSRNRSISTYIQAVMLAAGYLLVLHGILNITGYANYKNAILLSGPIHDLNMRLNSVFQYANAYAAYLVALLVSSLYVIVRTSNRTVYGLTALMLVPITLSLLLTGSKGGLVLLVASMMVLLLCLNVYRQFTVLLLLGVSFVISLALMNPAARLGVEIGSNPESGRQTAALLLIALPSIVTAAIMLLAKAKVLPWIAKKTARWEHLHFARYILVGAPIAAGLLGLVLYGLTVAYAPTLIPDYVRERLGTLNSYSERMLFYRDSLRIMADHMLTGVGGGGWGDAVLVYKTFPYQTTQAHSLLFQYAAEYGIFGLIALSTLIGFVFLSYMRPSRLFKKTQPEGTATIYFLFAFTFLLHSLIDFTMSFIYLYMLVFIAMGGMSSRTDDKGSVRPAASRKPGRWAAIGATTIALLSVLIVIQAAKLVASNKAFTETVAVAESGKNRSVVLNAAEHAVAYQYHNPVFEVYRNNLLIELFKETKDQSYYDRAASSLNTLKLREPFSRDVLEQELQLYASKIDLAGAHAYAKQKLAMYPWDIKLYEHLVSTGYQLGLEQRTLGNVKESDAWWDRSIGYYEEAAGKSKTPGFASSSQNAALYFDSSDLMTLNTGMIHYMRGNYSEAEKTLKGKINYYPQDATQKGIDRWYLAAIQKQNKQDISLYNQLISIDIKEKDLIEELLKLPAS